MDGRKHLDIIHDPTRSESTEFKREPKGVFRVCRVLKVMLVVFDTCNRVSVQGEDPL